MSERSPSLPLIHFLKHLLSVCNASKTGTMFVATQHRSIQITIHAGNIVSASDIHSMEVNRNKIEGVTLTNHYGLKLLAEIRHLKEIKFSFSEYFTMPQYEPSFFEHPEIDCNADIFGYFGIKLTEIDGNVSFGKKILIIDDSSIARRVAREALLKHHYEIIEATGGLQGLAKIAKEKPDLILLDIVMPNIDGYKVLSLIKANERIKNIPIIMLTSKDKLFDKIRGKISSADEYLTKPFDTDELINKVNQHLS